MLQKFNSIITEHGLSDLEAAGLYYVEFDPILALRFRENAYSRIKKLETFWAFQKRRGHTRAVKVPNFPYRIYFRVNQQQKRITIVALLHEHSQGPY